MSETTLHLTFSPEAAKRVDDIASNIGADRQEVMRRALLLFDWYLFARSHGYTVDAYNENGKGLAVPDLEHAR